MLCEAANQPAFASYNFPLLVHCIHTAFVSQEFLLLEDLASKHHSSFLALVVSVQTNLIHVEML